MKLKIYQKLKGVMKKVKETFIQWKIIVIKRKDDIKSRKNSSNEKLDERGKRLEDVSREEFDDIANDVGLQRFDPEQN